VNVVTRTQLHRGGTDRAFEGAAIHAAPGVHKKALELMSREFKAGGRVADIGAGSGALSLRLQRAGFRPVAVDLAIDSMPPGIEFVEANVCTSLVDALGEESVDDAVAVEVVEHLPDPIAFLRQAYSVIRPGGALVLSTPNILHPYSRLKFLLKGTYWLFDEEAYWTTGHTTPLPAWLLREHLAHTGYVRVEHGFAGDLELTPAKAIFARATRPLAARPAGALGLQGDGSTLFVVARKPAGVR
jgi:SAM-dependent methyltransferase